MFLLKEVIHIKICFYFQICPVCVNLKEAPARFKSRLRRLENAHARLIPVLVGRPRPRPTSGVASRCKFSIRRRRRPASRGVARYAAPPQHCPAVTRAYAVTDLPDSRRLQSYASRCSPFALQAGQKGTHIHTHTHSHTRRRNWVYVPYATAKPCLLFPGAFPQYPFEKARSRVFYFSRNALVNIFRGSFAWPFFRPPSSSVRPPIDTGE